MIHFHSRVGSEENRTAARSPKGVLCMTGHTIRFQPITSVVSRSEFNQPFRIDSDAVLHMSLKCHWDQNFGIPCFYFFEHSLWFLVTMPNFNLLRRLEVAFFGRFLSRFCGHHYWPLFRKLACEWAEVTSEAHLKPGAFTWLLPTG